MTALKNHRIAPIERSVIVMPAAAWLACVKERLVRPPNMMMSTIKKYPATGTDKFISLTRGPDPC